MNKDCNKWKNLTSCEISNNNNPTVIGVIAGAVEASANFSKIWDIFAE